MPDLCFIPIIYVQYYTCTYTATTFMQLLEIMIIIKHHRNACQYPFFLFQCWKIVNRIYLPVEIGLLILYRGGEGQNARKLFNSYDKVFALKIFMLVHVFIMSIVHMYSFINLLIGVMLQILLVHFLVYKITLNWRKPQKKQFSNVTWN